MPRDFRSPKEFATFLTGAASAMQRRQSSALKEAAQIIEREAKAEIGHYQEAAPPFKAWAELADSTKQDRIQKGFSPNDPLLRTGNLRESIGHAVAGREAAVGSNLDIAIYQELGTRTIPPRSFLGGAAVRKSEEVANLLGKQSVEVLVGPGTRSGLVQSDD
jgi:phage gpG-like protein